MQWPRAVLIGMVRAYRFLLKPWLGTACRFEPTCSAYALEALDRHGALGGSALAGWRLLRCHPWCDGGLDPVPVHLRSALHPSASGWLTRLVPGAEPLPAAEGLREAMPGVPASAATASTLPTLPHSAESRAFEFRRGGPQRPGVPSGEPS